MLSIWLFGSLSVAARDATASETIAIAGRSASLLAYLALGRGRYFSRTELLGTLWPERSSRMTAGSFSTALWRLRRLVERPPHKPGDLIVTDGRGAIGLNGPAGIWLDIEEFERLIAPGLSKSPERLDESDMQALRRGVSLYKADILLDLSDDWALREREKFRRNYLNALWRLMQLAAMRRDYAEGITHAQAILDSDALREDVHRQLMELFVRNGQRAHALRQFEHCRELLHRELAIQPMRETISLYQRIANRAVAPDPTQQKAETAAVDRSVVSEADSPGKLIEAARRHMAMADEELQLSLQVLAL